MSNGNIWATEPSHVIENVLRTMTADVKLRMERESQVTDMLERADPAKFMYYSNQNEQVTRLDGLQQTVTNIARERNGKFTTKDMMDINFMVTEFETWQNKQLGTLDVFKKDYAEYNKNRADYNFVDAAAAIENFQDTGDYKPGAMLQTEPINLYNRAR